MYEFTGKNEGEAIERASEALGLDSSQFDVEILGNEGGFFRRGSVRIRVYPHHKEATEWLNDIEDSYLVDEDEDSSELDELLDWEELQEPREWEIRLRDFMQELLRRMGQDANIQLYSRSNQRLLLSIQASSDPSQLIGKHGKHLEAMQGCAQTLIWDAYTTKRMKSLRV